MKYTFYYDLVIICLRNVALIICIRLLFLFAGLGILSFAIGYLTSSICYTITYYAYFSKYISQVHAETETEIFPLKTVRDFFPSADTDTLFDAEYSALVVTFYKQSLVKQFLTEGEKYMMTLFNILSFGEQGMVC